MSLPQDYTIYESSDIQRVVFEPVSAAPKAVLCLQKDEDKNEEEAFDHFDQRVILCYET